MKTVGLIVMVFFPLAMMKLFQKRTNNFLKKKKTNPGWGPRLKQVCPDRRWTHEGASCVQNYIVWEHQKTHKSLNMNVRKSVDFSKIIIQNKWNFFEQSGHLSTKTRRTKLNLVSAQKSEHELILRLSIAQKSGHEHTKTWWK